MTSLPPQRPTSQRRSTPPTDPSSSQQSNLLRTSSTSTGSVDSQTLLFNSPAAQSASASRYPAEPVPQDPPVQTDDAEPRRCWICFQDENEDDATSSEWRSPCPCVLVAHERCLLDWIADMEAPSGRRRAGKKASKVLCPQCKSEIVIQRPRNIIVDAVRAIERVTGMFTLPSIALITGTAAFSTLTLLGTNTIYQIFGAEDALKILGPLYETPQPRVASSVVRVLHHLAHHWRLDFGLPMIPTVLVLSRTTVADSFLPFLPLVFFVSSGRPGDDVLPLQWPPSAAFSFAALPYLRGFYNAYYERVWSKRERKWLKAVQPRAETNDTQDQADDENNQDREANHDHDHDHDENNEDNEDAIEIEVDVGFDLFADWNNGGEVDNNAAPENPPVPIARGPARPIDAPPLDDDVVLLNDERIPNDAEDAAPAPNVPLQPPANHPQRARAADRGGIMFSPSHLVDTILGALVFPSIAAAMGELLRHTLPASWVTPPSGPAAASWLGGWIAQPRLAGRPNGFLQTRWGRSLVGGCLFVGLKDAVLLYVRWKMMRNHTRRRIKDYVGHEKRSETRAR